jgi:hypothetical protein
MEKIRSCLDSLSTNGFYRQHLTLVSQNAANQLQAGLEISAHKICCSYAEDFLVRTAIRKRLCTIESYWQSRDRFVLVLHLI